MELGSKLLRPPTALSFPIFSLPSPTLSANDAVPSPGYTASLTATLFPIGLRSPPNTSTSNRILLSFGLNHESSSAPNLAASALPLEQDEARNVLLHALPWIPPFMAM
ncbi:hypothetical protein LY78DRAFT_664002 [Colletotrichum sublineola]|nr:hypothetical protein LY78DRAFT_664002 [Colletotrichum sublineola]